MTRVFVPMLFVLLAAVSVGAQPVSFTVSPADLELAVAPGSTAIAALTVKNNARVVTAFSARVEPSGGAWDAGPFLSIHPAEFSLQPGRTIALRVSASVPIGIEGGRYAHILIASSPSPTGGTIVANIAPRIAARVSVRVKGTEKISAGIQSIAARRVNGSVEVRLVFANRGNIGVRPVGHLTVLNDAVVLRTMPVRLGLVLPDSRWQATLTVDDLPRRGPYVIRATIDYGTERLSVGEVTLR